jgi:hypothetical protein
MDCYDATSCVFLLLSCCGTWHSCCGTSHLLLW